MSPNNCDLTGSTASPCPEPKLVVELFAQDIKLSANTDEINKFFNIIIMIKIEVWFYFTEISFL